MKNPHMLYRCPGPEKFEGVACETTTVEAEDVEAHLADGWHRDWIAAAQAQIAANEAEQARIEQKLTAAPKKAKG